MVRRLQLLGVACAGCVLLTLLVAAGRSAAGSPHCNFKVTGPQERPNNTLVSKASFRCTRAYHGAHAKVAVQRRSKGHWMTVGQTRTTLDIAIGKHYTVTARVPCKASTTFTGVKIRTLFSLAAGSSRFVLPSQPEPALCRFTSTS